MLDVANRIEGHTICALGDAAAWPVQSFLKHYKHEFQYMIEHKGRSIVEGAAGARRREGTMSDDPVNIEVNGAAAEGAQGRR